MLTDDFFASVILFSGCIVNKLSFSAFLSIMWARAGMYVGGGWVYPELSLPEGRRECQSATEYIVE